MPKMIVTQRYLYSYTKSVSNTDGILAEQISINFTQHCVYTLRITDTHGVILLEALCSRHLKELVQGNPMATCQKDQARDSVPGLIVPHTRAYQLCGRGQCSILLMISLIM